MDANLVSIAQASGLLEAQIMQSMLSAHGIETWLSSEAAASVYGLGVGPMAVVHLLVREVDQREAEKVMQEYYSGDLSLED